MNFFSDSYLREFDEKNNLKSRNFLYICHILLGKYF